VLPFRNSFRISMAFLGLLVPLLSSGCGSAPDEPPVSIGVAPPEALEAPLEGVRERLRAVAEKGVAVSVALARSGEILWSEAHGYAHAEEHRPATPETRFRIYSVVKPMTAVAAARLMEAGRLDPNVSVQRYVPDVPEHLGAVTAMQLATHTSGIRHYADEAEGRNRQHCESVEDALALFSMDPLVHAPGERETYSSWGFVLLSAVIQGVGEEPFPEVMRRLVFEPAGMVSTVLDDPGRSMEHRAAFYRETEAGAIEPEAPVDNTCKWGAGAFVSTAQDVAHFGQAMIDGSLISEPSQQLFLRGSSVYSAQGIGAGGTAFLIVDAEHSVPHPLPINPSPTPTPCTATSPRMPMTRR
jgi:serine beta-lactamase-like protein LACTB, mitochondrial